jgi:ribosome maturation factor RimP
MHDLANIEAIARRVAESAGLELVEVEMRGGGKGRMLRVVIDRKPPSAKAADAGTQRDPHEQDRLVWGTQEGEVPQQAGVTHEDCANVSREISAILDVEDAVPGAAYTLEVSSPGLDRKLRGAEDFRRFTGSRVKLTTRQPLNGNRFFEGRLESFRAGQLTLDVTRNQSRRSGAHEKLQIDLANVEKANLVPEV